MEKKKILLLLGDLWHPADVITRGLASFPENEFAFDAVETAKDILTETMIRRYAAIVCMKSNSVNAANNAPWFEDTVTEVGPKAFAAYTEEGHGFLALHAGLAYRRENQSDMTDFLGAEFLGHPLRCRVDVRVADAAHPICRNVESFSERDEHYQIALNAPDAHVFLQSQSASGGTQIAGYTRRIGKGRFCALTPGHTLAVLENPQYQRLVLNALRWCADGEA